MIQTQTAPQIEQVNTTAADERDEIRREISDQLTVKVRLEIEGDPDAIGGTRLVETDDITPHRVVLNIDPTGLYLPLKIEGSTDGLRWTATLHDYTGRDGKADFQVEATA